MLIVLSFYVSIVPLWYRWPLSFSRSISSVDHYDPLRLCHYSFSNFLARNPKSFNLITETPSETADRTLTLVAKCLQNLANLVEFGAKEPYMNVVNPFIVRNKARMVEFLNELSSVHENPCAGKSLSLMSPWFHWFGFTAPFWPKM